MDAFRVQHPPQPARAAPQTRPAPRNDGGLTKRNLANFSKRNHRFQPQSPGKRFGGEKTIPYQME